MSALERGRVSPACPVGRPSVSRLGSPLGVRCPCHRGGAFGCFPRFGCGGRVCTGFVGRLVWFSGLAGVSRAPHPPALGVSRWQGRWGCLLSQRSGRFPPVTWCLGAGPGRSQQPLDTQCTVGKLRPRSTCLWLQCWDFFPPRGSLALFPDRRTQSWRAARCLRWPSRKRCRGERGAPLVAPGSWLLPSPCLKPSDSHNAPHEVWTGTVPI